MRQSCPEYLNLRQAAERYPGLLTENTMRCWIKRGSHGFNRLITRAGRNIRIRADRLAAFVGERHA